MPDPPSTRAIANARFKRIMIRMALVAALAAVIAVAIVAQDPNVPVHALIATALGVGLTVLLGTVLMSLAFLSSSGGYDEESGRSQSEREDQ